MYAESGCSSGLAASGGEMPYNENFIVLSSIRVVRDWILLRGKTGGSASPLYKAPQNEAEWGQVFRFADIDLFRVRAKYDFDGCLLRLGGDEAAPRWTCLVNACISHEKRCHAFCCQYCEWLMSDCAILGYGRPEVFSGTTLGAMRRRIANAVAADLC